MKSFIAAIVSCFILIACNNASSSNKETNDTTGKNQEKLVGEKLKLPKPYATKSAQNESKVVDWPEGKGPLTPLGFNVVRFVDKLESPRWMYVAPNGDLFVAQASRDGKKGNNILLFRDADKDGLPEIQTEYLKDLNQPFGMLVVKDKFYVGNTNALMEFPYSEKATSIKAKGKKLVELPTGRHWTRNIVSNTAGDKIYIAVGSGSNVAEDGIDKESRRANILEVNLDGTGERVFASGLRNPVGMDWETSTNTLWTAVNERDELGDDLVPDYLVGIKDGGFYGWPYSYFGQNEDPRIKDNDKRPDLVKQAIVPDVALGSHTASLGLAFYKDTAFPAKYRNGAFVAQHGSWNRSHLSGYKVVFIPFANGKPSGQPEEFLTGFIGDDAKSEVYGRPVGVAVMKDGSLLVTDDGSSTIWRISREN